ncbi:hypothetical protein FPV67DRAFT_1668842 [Lyophyllum atratum]|nr:hypothetical protein FPV67DRAFT_1668842 [Lyophyllum atratum]
MPAFRNLKTRRSSGRIWNKVPIAYDEQGWETLPAMIDYTRNDISSPHSTATSPSATSADSDFENHPVPSRKSKGKGKAANPSNADYVPRPKNAFILYRSHFYQTLGGNDQNQISVAAGKAWKALCDEEKLPFQLMAEKEKRDHQLKFPHYTYAPGCKGPSSKRKAAGKKKSQPSVKKTLVPKPIRVSHRASRILASPLTRNLSPLSDIALPTLPQVPHILSDAPEPTFHIKREEILAEPESLFTPGWSFVPTSEIPPLELSPVKTEKDTHADFSSVRPSSYDLIDDQFRPHTAGVPRTVEDFLAGETQVELYYNYVDLPDVGPSPLHTPEAASPSYPDWAMDTAGSSPDIKFEPSYFDYPLNDFPHLNPYDSFNPAPLHASDLYDEKFRMLPPTSSLGTPSDDDLEMEQYINYYHF